MRGPRERREEARRRRRSHAPPPGVGGGGDSNRNDGIVNFEIGLIVVATKVKATMMTVE